MTNLASRSIGPSSVAADARGPVRRHPEPAFPLGGRILQTSLPADEEERLRDAVRLARAGHPG